VSFAVLPFPARRSSTPPSLILPLVPPFPSFAPHQKIFVSFPGKSSFKKERSLMLPLMEAAVFYLIRVPFIRLPFPVAATVSLPRSPHGFNRLCFLLLIFLLSLLEALGSPWKPLDRAIGPAQFYSPYPNFL